MKPVANSQKRKLWVSLMVLKHQYVLLLALVQAQKGPTVEGRKEASMFQVCPQKHESVSFPEPVSQMPSDRLIPGTGF